MMAEGAKQLAAEQPPKKKRVIDPDSAAYKLGEITARNYEEVWEAKRNGEKIGWCSSNFPQELHRTLDIKVCYPENQAVAIAVRGGGVRGCTEAEELGYSNDICAYARISMAYARHPKAPEQDMPLPDFLLCCNNICNCMIKWYEDIARELDIPIIMIDIPFNHGYEADEEQIAYVGGQFRAAIEQLEEITGKKWDEKRFEEVCQITNRSSRAMLKAASFLQYQPAPLYGFDLFNHMGVLITALGAPGTPEALELLCREYEQLQKEGKSTFRAKEEHRIMYEGIACWPHLKFTSKSLISRGVNITATIYGIAVTHIYDDFDGMIASYFKIPGAMSLERSRDIRVQLCQEDHVEGLLVHTNRSCKLWSGFMPEMSRQIGQICDIPVASFDGDQADARNFSEAQYETRVDALVEIMAEKKGETA